MLRLSLLAPDGQPLPGTDAQLTVDATHFGTTALVIIAIAIAVFVITARPGDPPRRRQRRRRRRPRLASRPGQDANGADPAGSPGETDTVVTEACPITTHPRSRMSTPAPQAGWSGPDGGRRAPPRLRPDTGGPPGRRGQAGSGVIQATRGRRPRRDPAGTQARPGQRARSRPRASRPGPAAGAARRPARRARAGPAGGGPDAGPGADRAASAAAEPAGPSLVRSSGVMALGTLASRGTGFLRTLMLVYALGVTGVANAYNNANTLPNAVYDLMLGGILTSVVVPLLVSAAKRDTDRGEAYTSGCSPWPPARCSALTVVATLAASLLVDLYAHALTGAGAPPDGDLRLLLHPADLLLRGELAGRRGAERARPLRRADVDAGASTTSWSSASCCCSSPPAASAPQPAASRRPRSSCSASAPRWASSRRPPR